MIRFIRVNQNARLLLLLAAFIGSGAGCSRRPDRPNLVLVVIDTVRRDHTPCGVGSPSFTDCTPTLDRIAGEGTVFTHAWSTAPWTVPAHASLFTGLLPSGHRCTGANPVLDTTAPTLAGILGENGYETAAFYSNPWLSEEFSGLLRGFEQQKKALAEVKDFPRRDQGGKETIGNIARWLSDRRDERPFFLFVNLLEAHLPYDPPREYRDRELADLPPDLVVSGDYANEVNSGKHIEEMIPLEVVSRLYAGDVNLADQLVSRLVDLLKEHGLYDRSVLIITSDHGENLGEHGLLEHQYDLHETLLAVPLIIRSPGRAPSGIRDDPVMLCDLFPTLLEAAGVRNAEIPPRCRSLFGPALPEMRPVISEYAGPPKALVRLLARINLTFDRARLERSFVTVRRGRMRLTIGSDGSVELNDLSADPMQRLNIADERPDVVRKLRSHLGRIRPAARRPGDETPGIDGIDDDMRRELRSLGYVD